jgi:hypothetical protein
VNSLAGGSSKKETIVPALERRVVFGGVEALYSFHKEVFLEKLEQAAAPIMKPASVLASEDANGALSTEVAIGVANAFITHAAFMRMYSTYIK